MVVHNLYLLDKDGISLVDITVGSLKIDPNLASGFFAAILKFIKELLKSDEEVITDMGMLNNRLYFLYLPPLIGVIVVDNEDDREEVTSVTKYILQEFLKKYDLTNWDHDIYPFQKFRDYMKENIKKQFNEIKNNIFFEASKIYNRYKKYNINDEWDAKIDQFQQELGTQFMLVTGTLFEYMGSKIMGAKIMDQTNVEPDYNPQTKILLSKTSLNIWNKELAEVLVNVLKYIREIDVYFAERYQS